MLRKIELNLFKGLQILCKFHFEYFKGRQINSMVLLIIFLKAQRHLFLYNKSHFHHPNLQLRMLILFRASPLHIFQYSGIYNVMAFMLIVPIKYHIMK